MGYTAEVREKGAALASCPLILKGNSATVGGYIYGSMGVCIQKLVSPNGSLLCS